MERTDGEVSNSSGYLICSGVVLCISESACKC